MNLLNTLIENSGAILATSITAIAIAFTWCVSNTRKAKASKPDAKPLNFEEWSNLQRCTKDMTKAKWDSLVARFGVTMAVYEPTT